MSAAGVDVAQELLPRWREAWIGRDYWPTPLDHPHEPVRALDIRRYASAVRDTSAQWRDRDAARSAGYDDIAAPPGFAECFSPNYLNYHVVGGLEFLHRLLPFDNPWGPDWTPLMLVRQERWTVDRPIVVGDVISGRSIVTDIGWEPRRRSRPDMLTIEFTKTYRDAAGERVAEVVWDMGFLESPLTAPVPLESPAGAIAEPALSGARRPEASALVVDEVVGRTSRLFDMEAQVTWSAAVWDLGVPHVDPDYARTAYGLSHVVIAGPFLNAAMATVVTGWLRPEDRLVSHDGRFRRPVIGNDRVTFTARLVELTERTTGTACVLQVEAHNQWGALVAESRTTCQLAG